jgi:hypothetical protein
MKRYAPPEPQLPFLQTNINKNVLSQTPKRVSHCMESSRAWRDKLDTVLSSPSRKDYDSFTRGIEHVLTIAQIEEEDL